MPDKLGFDCFLPGAKSNCEGAGRKQDVNWDRGGGKGLKMWKSRSLDSLWHCRTQKPYKVDHKSSSFYRWGTEVGCQFPCQVGNEAVQNHAGSSTW